MTRTRARTRTWSGATEPSTDRASDGSQDAPLLSVAEYACSIGRGSVRHSLVLPSAASGCAVRVNLVQARAERYANIHNLHFLHSIEGVLEFEDVGEHVWKTSPSPGSCTASCRPERDATTCSYAISSTKLHKFTPPA